MAEVEAARARVRSRQQAIQRAREDIRRLSQQIDATTIRTFGGATWNAAPWIVDEAPWAMPRRQRMEPELNATDIANVAALLRTHAPGAQTGGNLMFHAVNPSYTGGPTWFSTYTRSGGYALMVRSSGDDDAPYFLNLDFGELVAPQTLSTYRTQILSLTKELGHPKRVVPVGLTALRNGPGAATSSRAGLRAISVEGVEAVLMIPTRGGVPQYYLSGYDSQESPPLYFLCRLPERVETVAEAREALKPKAVRVAEGQGLRVERQGDLFAIRSDLTDDNIVAMGGKIYNYEQAVAFNRVPEGKDNYRLYGTIHTGSRVARLPDGRELATGQLVHDPKLGEDSRQPDHRPRVLDGGWWWIAPNTVPKGAGQARRRMW